LQRNHAAIAADADDLADNVVEPDGDIERGHTVSPREQVLVRNLNDAMGCECFAAAVENNVARFELIRGLAPHREHISGPNSGQHAEPCNPQARRTRAANHVSHQIAACRFEARLANHGSPALRRPPVMEAAELRRLHLAAHQSQRLEYWLMPHFELRVGLLDSELALCRLTTLVLQFWLAHHDRMIPWLSSIFIGQTAAPPWLPSWTRHRAAQGADCDAWTAHPPVPPEVVQVSLPSVEK